MAFLKKVILGPKWFYLLVLLPTLCVSGYYFFLASSQYVSESKFIVRSRSSMASAPSVLQILNVTGLSSAHEESYAIQEFVTSKDALSALDKQFNLRKLFQDPSIDPLSRFNTLFGSTQDDLLRYYRQRVEAFTDSKTGITTLRIFAFTPEQAQSINIAVLKLSELVVNKLNTRANSDALDLAQSEIEIAELRVERARTALTAFRNSQSTLDPGKGSLVITEIISSLETLQAETSSKIKALEASGQLNSPRLQLLKNKEGALKQQIAREKSRLTGKNSEVPEQLETYESLLQEKEFADKALASATTSLEVARIEVRRQTLYIERIVDADIPDSSSYPRPIRNTLVCFFGLLVAFALGRLLLAGAREHAD